MPVLTPIGPTEAAASMEIEAAPLPTGPRPRLQRVLRAPFTRLRRLRGDMATPLRRALGAVEHVLLDHAAFRYVYLNRHEIAPGVERAAQPSPGHIARAAKRGVRVIVNLRGERDCASYLLQRKACARHGIRLVDFVLTSRGAPTREQILGFDALTRSLGATPLLMHCKSGADRAGLASALYLMLRLGRPVEEALGQLGLRYGHIRQAKTGVLDAFLLAYKRDNDREPIDFRRWVAERYDRDAVTESFRSGRFAGFAADRLLGRE